MRFILLLAAALRILAASVAFLLLAPAASAVVVVTLDCDACILAPNPGVLTVGETVEFACDANCSRCQFVSFFGEVTGVTPFDLNVLSGTSSPPLGPVTVPDQGAPYQAKELPSDQDCNIGTFGSLSTPPAGVPGLADWGLIGLAALLVVASVYVLHIRRVPA